MTWYISLSILISTQMCVYLVQILLKKNIVHYCAGARPLFLLEKTRHCIIYLLFWSNCREMLATLLHYVFMTNVNLFWRVWLRSLKEIYVSYIMLCISKENILLWFCGACHALPLMRYDDHKRIRIHFIGAQALYDLYHLWTISMCWDRGDK